ncbi:hypothetical protein TNCV_4839511 [Trichonephila clavipes]|nr:hypothetical protein TNCV_4839511 [Trichonephila clavipes]
MTIVAIKDPINAGDARVFSILRKSAISQLNALNAQGLTRLKTIANDEGVDEELLARAFRAALRKRSHPDDKACEIFQAYVGVIDDLCSDHLPVILTLYTNSDTMKIPAQLSINWENFRFLLKNKPLPIPASPSNEHLDVAIGRLGENIPEELVAASKP